MIEANSSDEFAGASLATTRVHGAAAPVFDERLSWCLPSLSSRVDLTGHCAEGGGREVLMQVTRSLAARIRKWLGRFGKRRSEASYGAGAWGR